MNKENINGYYKKISFDEKKKSELKAKLKEKYPQYSQEISTIDRTQIITETADFKKPAKVKTRHLTTLISACAAVVIVIGVGAGYMYNMRNDNLSSAQTQNSAVNEELSKGAKNLYNASICLLTDLEVKGCTTDSTLISYSAGDSKYNLEKYKDDTAAIYNDFLSDNVLSGEGVLISAICSYGYYDELSKLNFKIQLQGTSVAYVLVTSDDGSQKACYPKNSVPCDVVMKENETQINNMFPYETTRVDAGSGKYIIVQDNTLEGAGSSAESVIYSNYTACIYDSTTNSLSPLVASDTATIGNYKTFLYFSDSMGLVPYYDYDMKYMGMFDVQEYIDEESEQQQEDTLSSFNPDANGIYAKFPSNETKAYIMPDGNYFVTQTNSNGLTSACIYDVKNNEILGGKNGIFSADGEFKYVNDNCFTVDNGNEVKIFDYSFNEIKSFDISTIKSQNSQLENYTLSIFSGDASQFYLLADGVGVEGLNNVLLYKINDDDTLGDYAESSDVDMLGYDNMYLSNDGTKMYFMGAADCGYVDLATLKIEKAYVPLGSMMYYYNDRITVASNDNEEVKYTVSVFDGNTAKLVDKDFTLTIDNKNTVSTIYQLDENITLSVAQKYTGGDEDVSIDVTDITVYDSSTGKAEKVFEQSLSNDTYELYGTGVLFDKESETIEMVATGEYSSLIINYGTGEMTFND